MAGQLSGEGNSAAFREFAWRFVNIIARALVALFDPKGDADLMKRVWAEAHRAGRGDELYIFSSWLA